LLLVHAEDEATLAAAPRPVGSTYQSFLNSRPTLAEDVAVAAVIDAARATGARVHIVHLSSAGAVPMLREARDEGLSVTAETCPHYLTLVAEQVPDGATQYKCCPPVRTAANRELLWAALSSGTIDMVVSDHSPCPPALKRMDSGDFAEAWGGISSLQLGLPLMWTAARARGFGLVEVVRWMAAAPASFAGLATKGTIAVGAAGDLVAFAPEEEMVVDPQALHSRHPTTPYAGSRLFGAVRATWLAGRQISGDGADAEPRGRVLAKLEA
jgi:allantoinase